MRRRGDRSTAALGIALALLFIPLFPVTGAAPSAAVPPDPRVGSPTDRDADRVEDALEGVTGVVRVLVRYDESPTEATRAAVQAVGGIVKREIRVVPVLVVEIDAAALPRLAESPGVRFVSEDFALRPTLDESRAIVKADAAQKHQKLTGAGVTVAVFDTGIDLTHPDFSGRLLASFDASIDHSTFGTFFGLAGEPSSFDVRDAHGTHVAGIVAGSGAQSGGRYAGIAPGAGLLNVKVFDLQGDSAASYVLTGIDWALDTRDEYRTRVFQMSLGGKPTDGQDDLSEAIGVAANRGILTVVSAGNAGPGERTIASPGGAPQALTVAAVDKALKIAPFSSRGATEDGRQKPDLAAPGVAITSTYPKVATATLGAGKDYGELSGTSMAAPHVAGAAALLFEANASLSPSLAKWILMASSTALGPRPHEWDAAYGWGLLNVEAAVAAAKDPALLGRAPFAETAHRVPFDGPVSPLTELEYELDESARDLPAEAPVVVAGLLLALAILWRPRPPAGRRQKL